MEAVALHHGPNRVPHQNFDAISAVYAANLLAHELEESSSGELAVYSLENCQEELTTLGVGEMIPAPFPFPIPRPFGGEGGRRRRPGEGVMLRRWPRCAPSPFACPTSPAC